MARFSSELLVDMIAVVAGLDSGKNCYFTICYNVHTFYVLPG
jgi:hypothetical protein